MSMVGTVHLPVVEVSTTRRWLKRENAAVTVQQGDQVITWFCPVDKAPRVGQMVTVTMTWDNDRGAS